mmetsp:Transcript_15996/g.20989  ORF Transcript_15996/g.20989 Transcript_15996/m.20989 type:complete len:107 (-) Transcript_15996:1039-1359(-)|eukprot:CAMPEP_0197285552 /NCGR_PEP_ID=MMETSP0890-20130614/883_1 /TAXON_ID=44058 ORGANISM="Aureoumbra lagunensis, Strain CCMP1510" /NCGR_SAMPLE_ID=MMETSP0890 /ASSEMBLY_ACC=CAM_ASM_000533 /LENGTH=106 /DNA_ID=CAMNT_0042753187 /DNA_START=92 /DNA_END=412 /DNA_ORIENTATION=+
MTDVVDPMTELTIMFGEDWDESTLKVILLKNNNNLEQAIEEVIDAGSIQNWNQQQLIAQGEQVTSPALSNTTSHHPPAQYHRSLERQIPSGDVVSDVRNPLAAADR